MSDFDKCPLCNSSVYVHTDCSKEPIITCMNIECYFGMMGLPMSVWAKLAEANEIAHLLYTTNASANACVVYEEHRARIAKDES